MTQSYLDLMREKIETLKFAHSYEAYQSVSHAIRIGFGFDKPTNKNFIGEIQDFALSLIEDDGFAYDWLKRNGVSDLTPAFCAGARYIKAIAFWFLKKDALSLLDEVVTAVVKERGSK